MSESRHRRDEWRLWTHQRCRLVHLLPSFSTAQHCGFFLESMQGWKGSRSGEDYAEATHSGNACRAQSRHKQALEQLLRSKALYRGYAMCAWELCRAYHYGRRPGHRA